MTESIIQIARAVMATRQAIIEYTTGAEEDLLARLDRVGGYATTSPTPEGFVVTYQRSGGSYHTGRIKGPAQHAEIGAAFSAYHAEVRRLAALRERAEEDLRLVNYNGDVAALVLRLAYEIKHDEERPRSIEEAPRTRCVDETALNKLIAEARSSSDRLTRQGDDEAANRLWLAVEAVLK